MKKSRLRIIVTGLIAQHPGLGGVAWDYLQYAVGLHRLGHDVYYFEDSGEWPYSLDGGPSGSDWELRDPSANLAHLSGALSRYGMSDRWAYYFPRDSKWFGLTNAARREVVATADLLINVSGTLKRPADYRSIPRLAYIDSDPVFTQVKLQVARGFKKFQNRFKAHDVYFTFGERIPVSESSRRWLTTRQPILLSEWNPSTPSRSAYTTVMSWTSYKPLTFQGRRYAQKDVEFRRFLDLPTRVAPVPMEVALGGTHHDVWQTPHEMSGKSVCGELERVTNITPAELLAAKGWHVVDPMVTCGDLDRYRGYIESSRGEWSVAKHGYVAGHSGWFSCRSACYLAAGRPVIVQDTGSQIPRGLGFLAFATPDEAAEAILEVESDYPRHAKAARELAAGYFDSAKVLRELIDAIA